MIYVYFLHLQTQQSKSYWWFIFSMFDLNLVQILYEGSSCWAQDLKKYVKSYKVCNIPKIHIQKSLALKIIFKIYFKNYKIIWDL